MKCDRKGCRNFASLKSPKYRLCRRCFGDLLLFADGKGCEMITICVDAFMSIPAYSGQPQSIAAAVADTFEVVQ